MRRLGMRQEERDSLECFFAFNDTATTEIYTLSLHDALPIWGRLSVVASLTRRPARAPARHHSSTRSEEHTSELQSPCNLVCRLLLATNQSRPTILQRTTRRYTASHIVALVQRA